MFVVVRILYIQLKDILLLFSMISDLKNNKSFITFQYSNLFIFSIWSLFEFVYYMYSILVFQNKGVTV